MQHNYYPFSEQKAAYSEISELFGKLEFCASQENRSCYNSVYRNSSNFGSFKGLITNLLSIIDRDEFML